LRARLRRGCWSCCCGAASKQQRLAASTCQQRGSVAVCSRGRA
jgi:hypothetical protein